MTRDKDFSTSLTWGAKIKLSHKAKNGIKLSSNTFFKNINIKNKTLSKNNFLLKRINSYNKIILSRNILFYHRNLNIYNLFLISGFYSVNVDFQTLSWVFLNHFLYHLFELFRVGYYLRVIPSGCVSVSIYLLLVVNKYQKRRYDLLFNFHACTPAAFNYFFENCAIRTRYSPISL